jgi:hypothetical protein
MGQDSRHRLLSGNRHPPLGPAANCYFFQTYHNYGWGRHGESTDKRLFSYARGL